MYRGCCTHFVHRKFSLDCNINQCSPPQQLFLLDEGHIRIGALIEGNILDDGDVMNSRWLLQSREAQPVVKSLNASFKILS